MKKLDQNAINALKEEIKTAYGVELNTDGYVVVQTGENKIRFTTEETYMLASKFRGVTNIGVYVAKSRKKFPIITIEGCVFVRLLEGAKLVRVSKEQALSWMKGDPVKVGPQVSKTVIGMYGKHFLGSAVVDANGIAFPQVPKWRRIPSNTS